MKTEKQRAFIIQVAYLFILIALGYILLKYLLPLLAPFVLGFVFAYFLRRPIRFFSRKLQVGRRPVAILAAAVFYLLIGALLTVLVIGAYSGVRSFIQMLPQFYTVYVGPMLTDAVMGIEQMALQIAPELFETIRGWGTQMIQTLGQRITAISLGAVGTISNIAAFLPGFFIKTVLMVISTFFIAMDYDRLTGFVMERLSERAKQIFLQVREYLVGTLFVCIRSYVLIMCITFVELSIGLSLLGVDYALLIAALTAVFDILPVLGTAGVLIPWAVVAALSGRLSLALGLLVVYLVITVIRNIIEPKLVGSQLGLHPVVTLASMFAGAQLLGVVGLFGFPIGISLLRHLNDSGTIRLFRTAPPGSAEPSSGIPDSD